MGAKGFYLANEGHVVNLLGAVDIGGVAKVSDYFSMANYRHASIIITTGVVTNTATITVEESTTSAGAATTAIDFDYYIETTAAGDTLSTKNTTSSAAGFATGTNNNTTFVIEIDASQLTDGYPYLVVKATAAAACLISMVAVLTGARYPQEASVTAIT